MPSASLAINGGKKSRQKRLPSRKLFDRAALQAVKQVFTASWKSGVDFGYQGAFEEKFTQSFCRFMGGGYADAIASGSAAIHIALLSLGLKPGDEVIVSPVTDPGCVAPVLLQGFRLVIADAAPGGFNVGPREFEAAITPKTRAAILTHSAGIPLEMDAIMAVASKRSIKIIEDCSQAHGAEHKGRKVGTFGHAAAFSTMFSKTLATGSSGGIVYTQDEKAYWLMRALADRGKPFAAKDYDLKDPGCFLFPALNLNSNEIACAIGSVVLKKLSAIIARRRLIAAAIDRGLRKCRAVHPVPVSGEGRTSPFFHTVQVEPSRLKVTKTAFARAVAAEGIAINPDYRYLVCDWPWVRKALRSGTDTPAAREFRDTTFNILFHEKYTRRDADDIVAAIRKVENFLGK
jgi:dTDP-4-amino-4,6-dideoxygalactose transaminase